MTLHPALEQLFRSWNDADVVWALLRAPENAARPEGDVDVLLEARTAHAADRIARSAGFVALPNHVDDRHLVLYHRDTGHWLWLHCTTELAFGPYRAVRPGLESWWLTQRVTVDGMNLLPPAVEFWITLMHALLDQGRLSERSRRRLLRSAPAADSEGPLAEAMTHLLPGGWSPAELLARVLVGEWETLELLAPELQARAARRAAPPLLHRVVARLGRALRTLRGARRARGATVALLGPDGAGKSTLAAGLERSVPLPVRQVYMGLTGGWLRHVDRLRVPGVVQIGRVLVIWGRYLRAQYHAHRGCLVVFDRYIYDAEVPPPYPLSRWGRLGRWLDGRACPGPDLVLILDAPGQVMHRRKGEYDPATLEHWRQRFLASQRRRRNVAVLDTTQPADVVLAAATDRIWQVYARRWRRR